MADEAKACPTCGSPSRYTFVNWSGSSLACKLNKHDPWHDAPPQPAPSLERLRENVRNAKNLDEMEAASKALTARFAEEASAIKVQPTTGGKFEKALVEIERQLGQASYSGVLDIDAGLFDQVRAANVEEVERALSQHFRAHPIECIVLAQKARAAGVAEGRREMAREAFTNKRVWTDAQFMAWLERAGEETEG